MPTPKIVLDSNIFVGAGFNPRSKQRLAEFFFDRRVIGRPAIDIPNYGDQISRLAADIRPGRVEKDHVSGEEIDQT